MNDQPPQDNSSGSMTLDDIYFVVFRRKWIILFFFVAAIVGALAICVARPPRYRSEAQLFIRYIAEGKSLNPPGDDSNTRPLNNEEAGILDTEARILRSVDVAQQAAAAVGPERILAGLGGGTNLEQAAGEVLAYLTVTLPGRGSVVTVGFEHPNPAMAREVLRQVIIAYMDKHRETHHPLELFGDYVNRETSRLREQLTKVDLDLHEAKAKAGVTSLDDAKRATAEEKTKIQQDIFDCQAALAEHEALLGDSTNLITPTSLTESNNTLPDIPLEVLAAYRNACTRLDLYSRREQELLAQFTPASEPVKDLQKLVAKTLVDKQDLEKQYPALLAMLVHNPLPSINSRSTTLIDPANEMLQIRALSSKMRMLNSQLAQVQADATKIDEMQDTILELQRSKESLENELKYFATSLEQSRVEEALGAGKAANIGMIQSPSSPVKGWSKPFKKKLLMLVAGCMGTGIALAFLLEMFLDRTVKRPADVQARLKLPLLMAIRDQAKQENGTHPVSNADSDGTLVPAAAAEKGSGLRAYYEGLRDRLVIYFDVRNRKQKPKLVAVTSCGRRAGVSSIAAGLAASMSETGDGNVLLVDLNVEHGASRQFYRGKPACGLDEALAGESRENALVQSNLYVVTEKSGRDIPHAIPSRFAELMPKLKGSDYDYIIFDMPPVSPTSMTPRAARIMDMVILVVEAERTSKDVVKQAAALLEESKANVGVVLNRTRTYVPSWLIQDISAQA